MSKTGKIVLGILTFLPILLVLIYFIFMYQAFLGPALEAGPDGELDEEAVMQSLGPMMAMIGLMVVLSFGLLIYYIVDVVRNPKWVNQSNNKVLWVLVLIFGGSLGMIVYYFVEILKRPEVAPAPVDSGGGDDMV